MVIMSPFYVSPYYASFFTHHYVSVRGELYTSLPPVPFPRPTWFTGFSPDKCNGVYAGSPCSIEQVGFPVRQVFGTWDPFLFSKVYFHSINLFPFSKIFHSFHLSISLFTLPSVGRSVPTFSSHTHHFNPNLGLSLTLT